MKKKFYIHNIFHNTFTINSKQQDVIGYYWWLKKKIQQWVQIRTSNNLTSRIYCENVMNLALLKKKSNTQKISQDFSQQLSWKIFTNSHLVPPLSHFFTYYYYSATSTGVKYFVKFFASTKILKKNILNGSY